MPLTGNVLGKIAVHQLKDVDKQLDKIVKKIATTTNTTNGFWNSIQTDITKEYDKARRVSAIWSNTRIPIEYRDAVRKQFFKLKNRNIAVRPDLLKSVKFKDFVNTDASRQSLHAIINETTSSFITGYNSGEKTLVRLASLTQQINISEKQINKSIEEGFIEKGTVTASSKKLQSELMKQALDGKYITVIDKNGNPIQYKIKTYSDLVAQTKLRDAQTQAVVNTTVGLGQDLVQISSHNTLTAYDATFEGKIFSLSGNDPDFPVATDLPPFHPRCKHSISTVIKEGLEADGTLQDYIDFSNDTTDTHPTRKSHTPVSQREDLK